jgi:branched-chain amino acid transport system ATP-binding protein
MTTSGSSDAATLACTGLDAGYGRLTVVRDVDLRVGAGKVLAVLGPNGAGKTTLLLTIAGLLKAKAGTVTVRGRAVRSGSARRVNRLGVVLVPDSRALFTGLSTTDNLSVAARRGGMGVDGAYDLFPALARRAKVKVGMLSGGEQQMLALARALVQDPKVLLVDELSMGLAPAVVEALMPVVRQVADETGCAIVLVEQHVQLALEIADDAIVLVHGSIGLAGPANTLGEDAARLEAAYLGDETPVG